MYLRAVLLVLLVGVLLALTGCGGSDTSPWVAYAPPADVIAPRDLQNLAVQEMFAIPQRLVSVAGGDLRLFGFGRIPAITNLLTEVLGRALTDVLTVLPLQEGKGLRGEARLLALMQAAGQRGPAPSVLKQAQEENLFFDWIDPDTDIHWTGRVLEQDGNLLPTLHGVGPRTDCTVTLTMIFELGSRMRLSGTARGPIAAVVDVVTLPEGDTTTQPGRARLDASLALRVNLIHGQKTDFTSSTVVNADFQTRQDGGWVTCGRQDSDVTVVGEFDDALHLTIKGQDTEGVPVGEGLYWSRHDVEATIIAALADDSLAPQMNLVDNITFSDGMTGNLTVTTTPENQSTGGEVTGFLHGANGDSLATIDGALLGDPPLLIHWADGTDAPVLF